MNIFQEIFKIGVARHYHYLLVLMQCLFLMPAAEAEVKTKEIYLNSYSNCGHEKTFEVSLDREYLIKPDFNPVAMSGTSVFRRCEVTFHSHRSDGHVCLILEGNEGKIMDNNVELIVYDGIGNKDDEKIAHLEPNPARWPYRDICSTSRYITFDLREKNEQNSAEIKNVHLSFRVVDIRSPRRTLYLDGAFCNNEYVLLDSKVSLINRPRSAAVPIRSVSPECPMVFEKYNKTSNNSICLVYVPKSESKISCDSQWEFIISLGYYDTDNIAYQLRCNDTEAYEIHAWCGLAQTPHVTAYLRRRAPLLSNSSLEPPGEYRFLVTDYVGTNESLVEMVKASLDAGPSGLSTLEIVLIGVSIVLVVILIIIVYVNRQKCPCYKYSAVNKRDSSVGNDL